MNPVARMVIAMKIRVNVSVKNISMARFVNVSTSQKFVRMNLNLWFALTFIYYVIFKLAKHCPDDGFCNDNGLCNNLTGICECYTGYLGLSCQCESTFQFTEFC